MNSTTAVDFYSIGIWMYLASWNKESLCDTITTIANMLVYSKSQFCMTIFLQVKGEQSCGKAVNVVEASLSKHIQPSHGYFVQGNTICGPVTNQKEGLAKIGFVMLEK